MEALMNLLGKENSNGKAPKETESPVEDASETESGMSEAFEAGAQEVMESMKSGDSAAFADALKACIEMAR
jgi:predicted lipid-binding transport protein (Tim44 family)